MILDIIYSAFGIYNQIRQAFSYDNSGANAGSLGINLASSLIYDFSKSVLSRDGAIHNQDLQPVLREAFEHTMRELAGEQEDAAMVAALRWLQGKTAALSIVQDPRVLQAAILGDEAELWPLLWAQIPAGSNLKPALAKCSPLVREEFQRGLPARLAINFGHALRDKRHERAWVGFVTSITQQTHALVLEQQAQINQMAAEQASACAAILGTLETVIGDGGLLQQLAETSGRTLEGIGRLETAHHSLQEQVAEAVRRQHAGFAAMKRAIERRPLYLKHRGHEVAERVEGLVRAYTALFVGRETEFDWFETLLQQPSGLLVITAEAGYGKTALLANWVEAQRGTPRFVAYHFFSPASDGIDSDNRTDSLGNAYLNLLRQIYIYHGLEEELPTDREDLRNMLKNIWAEHPVRAGEPVVVVIDGLDEAAGTFSSPFPNPLPPGLFVVASARTDKDEVPHFLAPWIENSTSRKHVKRLPATATASYLRQSGDGELAFAAEDAAFVKEVADTTAGYPLYLGFLKEDFLETARIITNQADLLPSLRAAMKQDSKGFAGYVKRQYAQMIQSIEDNAHSDAVEKLFEFMTVALGDLSVEDASALTGLSIPRLQHNLPHKVTRWFTSDAGADAPTRYRFAHPRLAEEFRRVLHPQMPNAQNALLDYCASWRKNESQYALRHYPSHLIAQLGSHRAGDTGLQSPKAAKQVTELLTNLEFAKAKVEAGISFDLVRDYYATAEALLRFQLPVPEPLVHWKRFIDGSNHVLLREPWAFLQEAINQPDDGAVAAAAVAYRARYGLPHAILRRLDKQAESPFLAPIRTMAGHQSSISKLALAPHGQLVSASRDGAVKVWDLRSGECMAEFPRNHDPIHDLAVTTGGDIVTGSLSGTLRILSRTGPGAVTILGTKDCSISAITISASNRLMSAAENGRIDLWDLETSKYVRYIGACKALHVAKINGHFIRSFGDKLISFELPSNAQGNQASVWHPDRDRDIVEFDAKIRPNTSEHLALTRHSQFIITDYHQIFLETRKQADNESGENQFAGEGLRELTSFTSPKVVALTTTPDGRLITAHGGGRINVRDANTFEIIGTTKIWSSPYYS